MNSQNLEADLEQLNDNLIRDAATRKAEADAINDNLIRDAATRKAEADAINDSLIRDAATRKAEADSRWAEYTDILQQMIPGADGLRDAFAIAVLPVLVDRITFSQAAGGEVLPGKARIVAVAAYRIADAMLAARAAGKDGPE